MANASKRKKSNGGPPTHRSSQPYSQDSPPFESPQPSAQPMTLNITIFVTTQPNFNPLSKRPVEACYLSYSYGLNIPAPETETATVDGIISGVKDVLVETLKVYEDMAVVVRNDQNCIVVGYNVVRDVFRDGESINAICYDVENVNWVSQKGIRSGGMDVQDGGEMDVVPDSQAPAHLTYPTSPASNPDPPSSPTLTPTPQNPPYSPAPATPTPKPKHRVPKSQLHALSTQCDTTTTPSSSTHHETHKIEDLVPDSQESIVVEQESKEVVDESQDVDAGCGSEDVDDRSEEREDTAPLPIDSQETVAESESVEGDIDENDHPSSSSSSSSDVDESSSQQTTQRTSPLRSHSLKTQQPPSIHTSVSLPPATDTEQITVPNTPSIESDDFTIPATQEPLINGSLPDTQPGAESDEEIVPATQVEGGVDADGSLEEVVEGGSKVVEEEEEEEVDTPTQEDDTSMKEDDASTQHIDTLDETVVAPTQDVDTLKETVDTFMEDVDALPTSIPPPIEQFSEDEEEEDVGPVFGVESQDLVGGMSERGDDVNVEVKDGGQDGEDGGDDAGDEDEDDDEDDTEPDFMMVESQQLVGSQDGLDDVESEGEDPKSNTKPDAATDSSSETEGEDPVSPTKFPSKSSKTFSSESPNPDTISFTSGLLDQNQSFDDIHPDRTMDSMGTEISFGEVVGVSTPQQQKVRRTYQSWRRSFDGSQGRDDGEVKDSDDDVGGCEDGVKGVDGKGEEDEEVGCGEERDVGMDEYESDVPPSRKKKNSKEVDKEQEDVVGGSEDGAGASGQAADGYESDDVPLHRKEKDTVGTTETTVGDVVPNNAEEARNADGYESDDVPLIIPKKNKKSASSHNDDSTATETPSTTIPPSPKKSKTKPKPTSTPSTADTTTESNTDPFAPTTKTYVCPLPTCQKEYNTSAGVRYHMKTVHPGVKLRAKPAIIEGLVEDSKDDDADGSVNGDDGGVKSPKTEGLLECPVGGCDKRYGSKTGLSYHLKVGHRGGDASLADTSMGDVSVGDVTVASTASGAGDLFCEKCGKKYTSLPGLRYHMINEHGVKLRTGKKRRRELVSPDADVRVAADGEGGGDGYETVVEEASSASVSAQRKGKYSCEVCGKGYRSLPGLKYHLGKND
ncbi:hypothetical protein HK097_003750 [Rhizophlyctis rosea]|uniref:C2H2-type domain-containing protein n=1 Tax=Rhizophlyctis rosea TaxID=64517 RepID=A0AAD5WX25_9FUNG|nr:hypothetical protein HK097_003750 [Rhizophlyctis rosea]